MTTIDLHGLATRCTVRLSGSRADELADAVVAAWSRCRAPRGAERDGGEVRAALLAEGEDAREGLDVQGSSLDSVMQSLTQAVTHANIAAQTGRLFMFHAGAVLDPATGAALVYVAPGGTGKTTLSRTLGLRLGYLTDETLACTTAGLIAPYPKPLSVRPADYTGTKHELSPDALGLGATPDTARLGRLVLLDRRATASGTGFAVQDTVSAITALAPESSALSSLPRPLRALAELLETRPPVVRVTYAEASDVADDLLGLLAEAT